MSAEATVVRNYLDWMIELPWSNKDKKLDNIDIKEAKRNFRSRSLWFR